MSRPAIKLLIIIPPENMTEEENDAYDQTKDIQLSDDVNVILQHQGKHLGSEPCWRAFADGVDFPGYSGDEVIVGNEEHAVRQAIDLLRKAQTRATPEIEIQVSPEFMAALERAGAKPDQLGRLLHTEDPDLIAALVEMAKRA
jgi:hypothetical protein